MATSSCPKCPGTSFELKQASIKGAAFTMGFVQCSACGAVVGVIDDINVGNALKKLGAKAGVDVTKK